MIQARLTRGAGAVLGALLLCILPACASYKDVSAQGVNLSGQWRLNAALSEDAEALLQQRLNQDKQEHERREKRLQSSDGRPVLPPPESAQANDAAPVSPPNNSRRTARERYLDTLRQMLGISKVLTITQLGAKVQIISEIESRRFEAGTKSQVSMPEGELADSEVGWDGEWFVIDRKASGGPRVIEKYRWLKPTDQLESRLAWSGDSPLSGLKVRRVYDRVVGTVAPPDPGSGPVK